MKSELQSALFSRYIIDGLARELTPAQILGPLCPDGGKEPEDGVQYEPVMDESLDPSLMPHDFDPAKVDEYLTAVLGEKRELPLPYAGGYTRAKVAEALLDALWKKGEFRLEDITLKAKWRWTDSEVGAMAAFYDSVQSAAEYIDSFDIPLAEYSCSKGGCSVEFKSQFNGRDAVPAKFVDDSQSWLIYVPFETADYRLGGSLLSQATGQGYGTAPEIGDADYFADCYEVIREMVEDGILLSGASVGDGGLLPALSGMASPRLGTELDLSDLLAAYPKSDPVRLLFSEVPGVIVQIKDSDFDYFDAELLLQDVVYYPLGHPVAGMRGVKVKTVAKTGLQSILDSLLRNQGVEGED